MGALLAMELDSRDHIIDLVGEGEDAEELIDALQHIQQDKLRGWPNLLHDRCTRNELFEAKKINYPPGLNHTSR